MAASPWGFQIFFGPVARYVQNDPLIDVSGFSDARADYDGVGELFYASQADCDASLNSAALAQHILADGNQFFARVDPIELIVEEHALTDGRETRLKVFVFLKRPATSSREMFLQAWERLQADLLKLDNRFSELIRLLTSTHSLMPDSAFDGGLEMSFDSISDAKRGYAEWVQLCERIAVPQQLPAARIPIVAHTCVLFDSAHYKTDLR